ncbi:MAG: T9SS type A sorting domain-containing protein [Saprospiraceae bacterium]|nr:T9SS type A sorting domain-containing protein [Saprospiraceae bacterium]
MKHKILFKLSHSLLSVYDKRNFFLTSFFIFFLTNILLAFVSNPAEINGDNPRFPIGKMAIAGGYNFGCSTAYSCPEVIISSNAPICTGSTLILSVDNASDYVSFTWYNPAGDQVGTGSILQIPNVTPDMTGVYHVDVSDIYGCTQQGSKGIEVLPVDTALAGADQLVCNDNTTTLQGNIPQYGNGQWTLISGSGNITDPTSPSTTVTNLTSGENIFQWAIISSFGCDTSFDQVTITVGNPAPSITSNAPLCVGSTLILSVDNASDYVSFTWYNPAGDQVGTGSILQIPNVSPDMTGVYHVDVSDIYGCSQQGSKGIEVLPVDTAQAGADQLVCNDNTTTLQGNMPQYGNGQWTIISGSGDITDPTSPSTTVTNLTSGENIFQWAITSPFGCDTSYDQVTITVGNPVPSITSNAPLCVGSTLILSVDNASDYVSFTWYNPAGDQVGTGSMLQIPNVSPDMTGVYHVDVVDIYGCTQQGSKGIEVLPVDTAQAGADQLVCNDNTTTLQGNTPQYGNGLWTIISGSGDITDPTSPSTTVTNLTSGENIFQWAITSPFGCDTSYDQVTITVGNPVPSITSNAPLCVGSTLILSVDNASDYVSFTWYNPAGDQVGTGSMLQIPNVSPDMTGVYHVDVVDIYGCTQQGSKGIEVLPVDTAQAGADQLVCNDNTTTLQGNTPQYGNGLWTIISGSGDITDPTSPSTTVTNLTSGENIFQWAIASTYGCDTSFDQVTITVGSPAPGITSNAPLCVGSTLIFSVDNASDYVSFTWYNPTGDTIGYNSILQIPNVSPDMTGVYHVDVVDIYGCTQQGSKGIEVLPVDTAQAGADQLVCNDNTTTLQGNMPQYGNGQWTIISGSGDITDPTSPSTTVTNLTSGENIFQWAITSPFGCDTSYDQVTITVGNPAPSITSNAPLCEGSTLHLALSDSTLYESFEWTGPMGNSIGNNASIAIPNITVAQAGTYSVITTDSYGCQKTDSTDVVVYPAETADAGPDQLICSETTGSLSGNVPGSGSGLWSLVSGSGDITNPTNPTTTVTNLASGLNTFQWTITPTNGCPVTYDQITITVGNPAPDITSNAPLCEGSTLHLALSDSTLYESFQWTDPMGNSIGNNASITIPNITVVQAGTYSVITTDSYGCQKANFTDVSVDVMQIANAGLDQVICSDSSTVLYANPPLTGVGTWEIINGAGVFTDPHNANTAVSDLTEGENRLQWTINPQNSCPSSSDELIATVSIPRVNINSKAPLCEGADLSLSAQGQDIVSYFWTSPSGSSWPQSNIEIPDITLNDGGVYQLTAYNLLGCSISKDTMVTVIPKPLADAGKDQNICFGNSTTLQGVLPDGTSGFWTIIVGEGILGDPDSPTSTFVNNLPSTNPLLQWTVTNSSGCINQDTVLLNYKEPSPPAYAGDDREICISDGQITLQATDPVLGKGTWQIIVGNGNITDIHDPNTNVTNISAGPDNLLVLVWHIDDACHTGLPTANDTVVFTIDALPGLANILTSDTALCNQNVLNLLADEDFNGVGQWSIIEGPGSISNQNNSTTSIVGLLSGQNTVAQWTVSNGVCPATHDQITISIDLLPDNANAGKDTILCNTSDYRLAANPVISGIGNWSILFGNGSVSENHNANALLTDILPGSTTTLLWEVSSGVCPSNKDTITIQNDALPTIATVGEDQSLCNTSNWITTGNTPSVGTGEWNLISGSGGFDHPSHPQDTFRIFSLDEPVTLSWSISNGVCPVSADTISIINYALPDDAIAGDDLFLCDTFSILNATPVIKGQGSWSIIEGPGIIEDPQSNQTILSTLPLNSTSLLLWEVSNGTCPVNRDTLTVTTTSNKLYSQAGEDQSPCSAQSLTLNAVPAPDGVSGTWSILSGPGTIQNIHNPSAILSGLIPGQSSLLVWTISDGLCPDVSDTMRIDNVDNTSVQANFLIHQSACVGDTMALIDISIIPSDLNVTYSWDLDGQTSNVENPFVVYDESGPKNITLSVQAGQCISTSPTKQIDIHDCLKDGKDTAEVYNTIFVYPNPTDGQITIDIIQSSSQSVLFVYNVTGALIYREIITDTQYQKKLKLPLPGLYLIKILSSNYEKTLKVLKI